MCVGAMRQVDQAALTGESLPAKKFAGDVCFSGSTIKQGEKHALVYATGQNTFFGRAASLIAVCPAHCLPHRISIEAVRCIFCYQPVQSILRPICKVHCSQSPYLLHKC